MIFLSLRGRYDRSNLIKDRGLLRRSFLTLRNDSLDSVFTIKIITSLIRSFARHKE